MFSSTPDADASIAALPNRVGDLHPAVRFASVNQEIEPAHSLQSVNTTESAERSTAQVLPPETQAELEKLSTTFQSAHLQQRRMSNFAFEPVSLPASRVSEECSYNIADGGAHCIGLYTFFLRVAIHPSHTLRMVIFSCPSLSGYDGITADFSTNTAALLANPDCFFYVMPLVCSHIRALMHDIFVDVSHRWHFAVSLA